MAQALFNPPRGNLPALQWCLVEQLQVDGSYQRDVDNSASQALIRRIAKNWDWNLCQVLVVARRADGGLFVVDGQHRLTAAKMRSDIHQLPCIIANYDDASDEAASFVALNQERRPLQALALFRAALASGDAEAVLLVEIMARAGLTLSKTSNNHCLRPGEVTCIGGLRAVLRLHGERISREAMTCLAGAWPGEQLRYAGSFYQGLGEVLAQRKGLVDVERLTAVMGGGHPGRMARPHHGASGRVSGPEMGAGRRGRDRRGVRRLARSGVRRAA